MSGSRPPQKAYKSVIKNKELFAFKWKSSFFGQYTYLKFALANDCLWVVSLHKDRP